ncbi:hypothetical protein [Hahella ganghwensis]|uniref:hypothetical protein n=1 Tax=Hahella ganghwensis TaxID=286420 RepID=UPI00036D9F1A|nr:hypothetical protein [Hahella ganghwensis]
MKIHNSTQRDLEPEELRALARGELDPIKKAIEEHRSKNLPATSEKGAGGSKPPAQKTDRNDKRSPAKSRLPAKGGQNALAGKESKVATGNESSVSNSSTRGGADKTAPAGKENPQAAQQSAEQRKQEWQKLKEKQVRLIQIIRECEPLEVLNYELLALKQYPDAVRILSAKRRRDLWLLADLLALGVFLIGWFGFFPAWVAGVAFGVLIALLSFAIPPIRHMFVKVPDHKELVEQKKAIEFRAISHIRMLEGSNGLAYQCQMMLPYRKSLGDKRYRRIVLLSRQKAIIKAMRSAAAIRLYLMYMLEAQQAFKVVKNEYMKTSSRLQSEFVDLA